VSLNRSMKEKIIINGTVNWYTDIRNKWIFNAAI
jgi:hypothetical protein